MRFRTKSEDDPPRNYSLNNWANHPSCSGDGTVATLTYEGQYVPISRLYTMEDVVTPNYARIRDHGGIVNNPMTKVTTIREDRLSGVYSDAHYRIWHTECTPDKWWYYRTLDQGSRPSSFTMGGMPDGLHAMPSYDPTHLIEQAVSQAYANATLDKAMALVQLAESEKSVLSLVSIFKRLIKILRILRAPRDLKGAKYLLNQFSGKELADRYMEIRYALRPLMYDMRGAVAALQYVADPLGTRMTFRGYKFDSVGDHGTSVITKQNYTDEKNTHWCKFANLSWTTYRSFDVRPGILSQLESLSSVPVWGLTNPVEALWELVPYSFVIDWFINVGDVLSSWTYEFGLKNLASWYVLTDSCLRTSQYLNTWATTEPGSGVDLLAHEYLLSDCYMSEKLITKTRVPNPSRAFLPSFKLNINCFKLIDLVIIAKQLIG